jgi:2-polyprenyl-6-methoxyphenol hydroxylase-like FAD-dependent oxidoreductase
VRNAPRGRGDPLAGRAARLQAIFEDFAPPVAEILERARDADIHHADIDELSEGPWVKGRVALLGDAAHALTPNMGQGAAMAIEDAWVLAEQLETARSVPEALARYEALRRPRVAAIQRRSRALGRLAQLESRRLGAVRDLVTRLVPPRVAERALVSLLEASPVVVPGA